MKKSRLVVKNKLNEWYDWLVDHVPKPIKNVTVKAFVRAKSIILELYYDVKKTLKGGPQSQKQTEENSNITPPENEVDNCIRMEVLFNSLMTEFFEGSNINDLIQRI